MNKPLPQTITDQEAEQLLDQDLSDYLNKDNLALLNQDMNVNFAHI